jgi:DNA repair protein RadC
VTGGDDDIDRWVATLLPRAPLPEHLRYADLLDDAVIPPPMVAEKVVALRALLRCGGSSEPLTGRIASSRTVADYFGPQLRRDRFETIWVVGLDAKHRVTVVHQAARGGLTTCAVQPVDLLRPLVLNAAAGFLMVHNHPSGDPSPSVEDIALTNRLQEAAHLLGIALLDHVIIGRDGYFSFLDQGLLTPLP